MSTMRYVVVSTGNPGFRAVEILKSRGVNPGDIYVFLGTLADFNEYWKAQDLSRSNLFGGNAGENIIDYMKRTMGFITSRYKVVDENTGEEVAV